MTPAFTTICQTISCLSIAVNLYLLLVFFWCPLKAVKSYKYFFLLTALQDIIYSFCVAAAVPVAIAENYSLVFLATGPLRAHALGQVFVTAFVFVFITSIMLIANSFLYRYLLVCKHHLFHHIMDPRKFFIIVLVNGAIFANWAAVISIVCWPNKAFIERISRVARTTTGLNPFECAQLGISMKYDFSVLKLALAIGTVIFLALTSTIVIYSAIKIHTTLKKATISKSLRKLHEQMFKLLLLQSACPFMFLHGPSFNIGIFLFSGQSTPAIIAYAVTIMISLFPLLTPIIIIAFLKDYRNHALSTLRLSRRISTNTTLFVSEMKTTA
ncbi:7TM chemoreceptor [Ostertagia ostertagi]